MMKTIICGSRDINDYELVKDAIKESGFEITEVVCGCAKGIDLLGDKWGRENNIPVKYFPAKWKIHGKSAGIIRNKEMVEYADACIAITNGSKGTASTIDFSKEKGIKLFVKYENHRTL